MKSIGIRAGARFGLFSAVAATALTGVVLPAHAEGGGSQAVSTQAISVPKGQGSTLGFGESFSAQSSTGTSTFQLPISLPAARGSAQPTLALTYSSASGASVAGMGFSIGAPSISRQTDRGIPKYNDATGGAFSVEQDRFVLDGGQELVPICVVAGTACSNAPNEVMPTWASGWQYFRARVEGAFQRVFWSPDRKTWRIQDKSGETMELGAPLDGSGYLGALESDPAAPTHIFRWNLARKFDAQGPVNSVHYRYSTDGGNAYLTDIYDTPPVSGGTALSAYAHHARLNYEARPDASVSFRRGFASSMARRLVGVDVTSKGADASAPRGVVHRYRLAYVRASHVSLLESVTVEGRCADRPASEDAAGALAPTSCPSHPPVRFGYTQGGRPGGGAARFADLGFFETTSQALSGAPAAALDATAMDLFDVNADGLPDLLQTAPSVQVPEHGVRFNGASGVADAFGKLVPLSMAAGSPLSSADVGFGQPEVLPLDIDGDATVDLVRIGGGATSQIFTPKKVGPGWRWTYRDLKTPTSNGNSLDLTNHRSSVRVLDVNADGLVDLVVSEGSKLHTFLALGRYPGGDGRFGTARWTSSTTAALSSAPLESCAPGDSRTLQLDQPDLFTADMNGDGLVDLVRMTNGSVEYWPGRGDGSWGVVPPAACAVRAPEVHSEVAMANAPTFVRGVTDIVRIVDMNGDGLDDVALVSGGTVAIYINSDGRGFTTSAFTVAVPEANATASSAVRFADINGSGSMDVVWSSPQGYRYLDIAGGVKANLLSHVANGLGKTTDIEYATSTSLMLEAEKGGAAQAWTSKMPIVAHVVRRFTESDNLPVAGRPANKFVTELTYRNPVYDGAQREFRGFRETTSRTSGDANSPSSNLRQRFALGDCVDETPTDAVADCEAPGRFRDNGREALKGSITTTDAFADDGVFLATTHHTYTLRHLFTGLDGRSVRHAFVSSTDTWSYDTFGFVPGATTVETRDVLLDGIAGTPPVRSLTLASSVGRAHVVQSRDLDPFGNIRRTVDAGCVDGCATVDEAVSSVLETSLVPGDGSGWTWRTSASWIEGSQTPGKRKLQQFKYDSHGNSIVTTAVLEGTLPLDRAHETPGAPIAPAPSNASADGTVVVSSRDYDAFGHAVFLRAANNRCRRVIYDGAYATFPSAELVYVGALGDDAGEGSPASQAFAATPSGAACGRLVLPSTATFDRGLGVATQVTGLHGEATRIDYDGLGRMVALYPPHPTMIGASSEQPSLRFSYDVDPTGARAYTILRAQAHDAPTTAEATYRDSYAYVDGFGRKVVTLDQADPDPAAGDRGKWVVNGLTQFDHKGAPQREYLSWFSDQEGAAFPLANAPETAVFNEHRYDAFDREIQTIDTAGEVSLEVHFHAMSTDAYDAADLRSPTHAGTFTSTLRDGHGRKVVETVRVKRGAALELHETRASYLPTGEATRLTRVRVGSSDAPVVRWMRYDSLGRLVLNADPHASSSFALPEAAKLSLADPGRLRALRYAYDDSGALVGTSDARGCGFNAFYDAAGRSIADDVSPCLASQPAYSAPDLATGDGTESFTRFDTASPIAAPSCAQDAAKLLGRVSAHFDRGGMTVTAYDARGRSTCLSRRVTRPGAPSSALDARYASNWFTGSVAYDADDRQTAATTGAEVAELLGTDGASRLTTSYTKRGLVRVAGSSYGPLITNVTRQADGRVASIHYGDGAKTVTDIAYDNRLRIHELATYRGSAPTLSALSARAPDVGPRVLEDDVFSYDEVGNPIAIADQRTANEWPDGAKPVTRRMTYDDLNRLATITYGHPGSVDPWTSPFDAENRDGAGTARNAKPLPSVAFDGRVNAQSFDYDWLGNLVTTDDDAHGFYDRSLGTQTSGAARGKPYQLDSASNGSAGGATRQGNLRTKYDDAGNLVDMVVVRNGPCLPAAATCSHRFLYAWDETGNLSRARRWDLAGPGAPGDPEPPAAPSAELHYVYSSDGSRTLKSAVDAQGRELHTVYALASLELRRARFDGLAFERTRDTEVPYLFAHGVRVGRVVYLSEDVAAAASGRRRVVLEMGDQLGSASVALDLETGDLVERGTYQAYGSPDSDYRPEKWGSFREDYRFTGKEEDIEVGVQYFVKRYFAPSLGRWMSADPLALHQPGSADLNLYAYVHGAVLKATDPLGLEGAPLGSAANPIVTNEMPRLKDGTVVDVKAGAVFTIMKGNGVAHFKDGAEAQGAGARFFFRYVPGSGDNVDTNADAAAGAHTLATGSPSAAGPMTAGDVAERIAHPLADASPGGESGGIADGRCVGAGCIHSEALQAVDVALQVYSVASVAKSGFALLRAGYATIAARIAADRAMNVIAADVAATSARTAVPHVFWSGGKAAMGTAARLASRTGGTTPEMTPRGAQLEALKLPWAQAKPFWDAASTDFAHGASGEVHVVLGNVPRAVSVWTTIEKPILQASPAVTGIRVHLAVVTGAN